MANNVVMANNNQINTKSSSTISTASVPVSVSVSENLYMHLNESELTAITMKGSPNSNDRDAGFCSGSSEEGDDLTSRLEPCSPPTDAASDDSVEVKCSAISLIMRNKRKSSEPSKVISEREESALQLLSKAPLKKRIRYTSTADSAVVLTPPASETPISPLQPQTQAQFHPLSSSSSPFALSSQYPPAAAPPHQLWDPSQVLPHELMPNPAQVFTRHPGVTTLHRVLPIALAVEEQKEPLALVLKKPRAMVEANSGATTASIGSDSSTKKYTPSKNLKNSADTDTNRSGKNFIQIPAILNELSVPPPRPHSTASMSVSAESNASTATTTAHQNTSFISAVDSGGGIGGGITVASGSSTRPQQRNYKNMTRERRIEANARERTRVHTISASYEKLRRAVPSYSNAQKLSKLSVLRVACSYILTLSRMAGHDYSTDQSEPSIASCFDAVTETIQTEGKIRKKKDE